MKPILIESPNGRPPHPFSVFEAEAFLAKWYRLKEGDGSTVAYVPDKATAEGFASLKAECSRLRAALERCHKMILEDFTSEVRKAIPNWYEVEKAARAALKGGE